MKETLSICLGTFMLCCGLLLALGVESKPILAIPMLVCMGVGALLLRYASYIGEKRVRHERPKRVYKVYNYETGKLDARVA